MGPRGWIYHGESVKRITPIVVGLWGLLMFASMTLGADPLLQAMLSIRLSEGVREVPPRLVTELIGHLQHTIRDIQVITITKGAGRFVLVVSFPQEDRLKFEKMVVELPTATLSLPVKVESWNVNNRVESVGPTDETTSVAFTNFKLTLDGRGSITSAKLRETPLKEILSYLARTVRLQYVCPPDLSERTVCADLKHLSLDDFLRAVKLALGVEVTKQGSVHVFYLPTVGVKVKKTGSEE